MDINLIGDEDFTEISKYGREEINKRKGTFTEVTFVTTRKVKIYHKETFDMYTELIENKSNKKRKLYTLREVVKIDSNEIVDCQPNNVDIDGSDYGRDDIEECRDTNTYNKKWCPIVIMSKDEIKELYSIDEKNGLEDIKNNLYFPVEVNGAFIDKKVCVEDCNCRDCNSEEE